MAYALQCSDDGSSLKLNSRNGLSLLYANFVRLSILTSGAKVHGDLEVTGVVNSGTSDDRIKWNETPITNALDTIRLLKPHTYDKAHFIPEDGLQPENTYREAGFVAQEVLEIPELVQFVRPDGVEEVEVPSTDAENAAIDEAHKALKAQKVVEAQAVAELETVRDEVVRLQKRYTDVQKVHLDEETSEEIPIDQAVVEAVKVQLDAQVSAETTASAQNDAQHAITTQLEARLAEVRAAAVHPDITRIKPYALNYNSIFTHMIAAVKELDTLVQAQAARIAVLEAQN